MKGMAITGDPAGPAGVSARLACDYVLERGLTGLSLRPQAAAAGTSPRVPLYLFGSKDGLVQDLLAAPEQRGLVRLFPDVARRRLRPLGRPRGGTDTRLARRATGRPTRRDHAPGLAGTEPTLGMFNECRHPARPG
jgi:hypothetical protein